MSEIYEKEIKHQLFTLIGCEFVSFIRGKEIDTADLRNIFKELNDAHIHGVIESNFYDDVAEILEMVIEFFEP